MPVSAPLSRPLLVWDPFGRTSAPENGTTSLAPNLIFWADHRTLMQDCVDIGQVTHFSFTTFEAFVECIAQAIALKRGGGPGYHIGVILICAEVVYLDELVAFTHTF